VLSNGRLDNLTHRSDIWAFGCIVFQLLTGKPPFRGATDYLTFQKILKREFEYPSGFDEEAKSLIDLVLNPDPTLRPTAGDIKSHPFFANVDFGSLWTIPAPTITPGLTKPIDTLANNDSNSDVWAVFDDEVSEGGFEYDDDPPTERNVDGPQYDRNAAADAIRHDGDDLSEPQYPFQDAGSEGSDLQPPRPAFVEASPKGKWGRGRLDSRGSERTSSSSSTNRNALSGLLESLKLQGGSSAVSAAVSKGGSSRNSRTSDRSAEMRVLQGGANEPKREATTVVDDPKW
jgi:3-phosphoinositide dependent protein kinase-1